MSSQKYLAQHHSGGLRGLNSTSGEQKVGEKDNENEEGVGGGSWESEKKKKGLANKKRSPSTAGRWPGWSLVGRYISQDAGIHINQLAAVLQLWLWWKPLCCLGCKLRVHTESRALTLKGSKILILCVFHSPDMNMYYKAIKKKSIQMSHIWKVWALLRLELLGRTRSMNMKIVEPLTVFVCDFDDMRLHSGCALSQDCSSLKTLHRLVLRFT